MTGQDSGAGRKPEPARARGGPGRRTRLWRWLDRRTEANELLRASLDEPVPGGARLAYVFGSALLFLFISQIITGVCLAIYYVPSPLTAHVTLAYIIKDVAAGAFLRSLHSYGSSAMVVVLVLHFLQTLVYGSYKGRRELLWLAGCVLALLILGMTFTGYLLRWDLKAYFAGAVGTSLAGDIPLIGGWLMRLLRGGEMMGALTLSRFYVLHVFILPASIILFVTIHILLFRKAGAAGPITEDPLHPHLPAETFYPRQVIIDMAFVLVVMGILGMLAHFVPAQLGPAADPSNSTYLPRPEWYYLPFFEWLKFWGGATTVIGVVLIPGILIALVFLLPFLDRSPERRPWKRPIPVGVVVIVLIGLIWLGLQSRLDDSRDPTIASQLAQQNLAEEQYFHAPFQLYAAPASPGVVASVALSAAAAHGKTIFDSQGCGGCHGAGGVGGGKGPALTGISVDPAQLTALLKQPSAKMKTGGMVPLTLDAADMTALVSYVSGLGTASPASGNMAGPGSPRPVAQETKGAAPPVPAAAGTPSPAAAASPGSPDTASPKAASGEAIYQSRGCAACHGKGGKGTQRGLALADVGSKLTARQVTALLHAPTPKMKAGGMPPVTGSDQDIAFLVAYLRGLRSAGAAPGQATNARAVAPLAKTERAPAPATPASSASGPVSSQSQPTPAAVKFAGASEPMNSAHKRGEALFNAQGCAACHGPGGVGTSRAPALTTLGKTMSPAVLTSLLHGPNHKMQAGGMPPVNLPAPDMSALVAYLQSLDAPATAAPAIEAPVSGGPAAKGSPPDSSRVDKIAAERPMSQLETQGKVVFVAHACGSCHGTDGIGGTAAASALAGTGRSLPPTVLITMLQHPTVPMRKGGMPPVSVNDSELKALVAYLNYLSLSKRPHVVLESPSGLEVRPAAPTPSASNATANSNEVDD